MSQTPESLVEQFQEGRYLSHIDEYDAANVILLGCVRTRPDDADFVDAFLVNLARRSPRNAQRPQGDSPPDDVPSDVAQAIAAGDWRRALDVGFPRLVAAPRHVPLLGALATAAGGLGAGDVELRLLAAAEAEAPTDVDLQRRIGRARAKLRQYDQALAAWRQVESLAPEDPDASRMIAMLVTARSRQRNGLPADRPELLGDEFGRPPQPPRPSKPRSLLKVDEGRRPREVPQPAGEIPRTPIQHLEAAVREYPSDVVLYLQLAPMYLEKGRDYDAEKLLTKALEETDGEPRIRELWEDVTMQRLAKKIQQAQLRLEIDETDEARADYSDLCGKRDRLEIDFFVNRAKRNPDDTTLALELGRRLRQAGRLRDAMPYFERAIQDEPLQSAAAYELAECALGLRDPAGATRYFRRAIDAAVRPSDVEVRKKALLRAAELAAQIRLPALARSYLRPLLALDPQHKSAAALESQLAALS